MTIRLKCVKHIEREAFALALGHLCACTLARTHAGTHSCTHTLTHMCDDDAENSNKEYAQDVKETKTTVVWRDQAGSSNHSNATDAIPYFECAQFRTEIPNHESGNGVGSVIEIPNETNLEERCEYGGMANANASFTTYKLVHYFIHFTNLTFYKKTQNDI